LHDGFWEAASACPVEKGGIDMKRTISSIYYIDGSSALGPARLAASHVAQRSTAVSGRKNSFEGSSLPVLPSQEYCLSQGTREGQKVMKLLWSRKPERPAEKFRFSAISLNRSRNTLIFLATMHFLISTVFAATVGKVNFRFQTSSSRILMGKSTVLNVTGPEGTYWPFVNGSQWGSFCTIAPGMKMCKIILPVPIAGEAKLQIARLDRMWCQTKGACMFPVGNPVPHGAPITEEVSVNVVSRKVSADSAENRYVCMDWEPWFTRSNLGGVPWLNRPGAEGVPLVGLYGSFNAKVVRQHAIWFAEAGVNCIIVDWSNNLWTIYHGGSVQSTFRS